MTRRNTKTFRSETDEPETTSSAYQPATVPEGQPPVNLSGSVSAYQPARVPKDQPAPVFLAAASNALTPAAASEEKAESSWNCCACFALSLGPVAKTLLGALALALIVTAAVATAGASVIGAVAAGAAVGLGTMMGSFFAHQKKPDTEAPATTTYSA